MDEDEDFDDFEEATYAATTTQSEVPPTTQSVSQPGALLAANEIDLNVLSSHPVASDNPSPPPSDWSNPPQIIHSIPSEPSEPQNLGEQVPETPSLAHHHSTPVIHSQGARRQGGALLGGLDWSTAGTGINTETFSMEQSSPTMRSEVKADLNEGTGFDWGMLSSTGRIEEKEVSKNSPNMVMQSESKKIGLDQWQQEGARSDSAMDNLQTVIPARQPLSANDSDQPEIWEEEYEKTQPAVQLKFPKEDKTAVEQPIQPQPALDDIQVMQTEQSSSMAEEANKAEPEKSEEGETGRKESDDFEFQTAPQVQPTPPEDPQYNFTASESVEPPEDIPKTNQVGFEFLGGSSIAAATISQPINNDDFLKQVEGEQSSARKQSEDFEFQEAAPVSTEAINKTAQETHEPVKVSQPQTEEADWDFPSYSQVEVVSPINPVEAASNKNNVDLQKEQQQVNEQSSKEVEFAHQASHPSQEEDDEFGEFEEVVAESAQPVQHPSSPSPPNLPQNPDNTVQIPPHILSASPDLHQQKQRLQQLVDRLPDYSFLLKSAFLTLP